MLSRRCPQGRWLPSPKAVVVYAANSFSVQFSRRTVNLSSRQQVGHLAARQLERKQTRATVRRLQRLLVTELHVQPLQPRATRAELEQQCVVELVAGEQRQGL